MKDMLKLQFQLECIDYTKDNFVHADMSPTEFAQTMKDRGESVLQMLFRMMGQSMAQQSKNPTSDLDLLMALFSRDRAKKLKSLLAVQMEDLEGLTSALNGPDGSSTIIGERNRKALEVLARELKQGDKKLAIFYGAGHLPDMERRLMKDFGMRRQNVRWLPAWLLQR
jgi:hypothetical protein